MGVLFSFCDSRDDAQIVLAEVQRLRAHETLMRCMSGPDFEDSDASKLLQQHIRDLQEAHRLIIVSRSSARVAHVLNDLKGLGEGAYDSGKAKMQVHTESIKYALDSPSPPIIVSHVLPSPPERPLRTERESEAERESEVRERIAELV